MPNYVQEGYKAVGRGIGGAVGGKDGEKLGEKIGSGAFVAADTALSFVSGKAVLQGAKAAKESMTFGQGVKEVLKLSGSSAAANAKSTLKTVASVPSKVKTTGGSVIQKCTSLFAKGSKATEKGLESLIGQTTKESAYKLNLQFFASTGEEVADDGTQVAKAIESDRNTSFRDMMTPEEAARYDAYWKQGAGSYKNITENGTKTEIIIRSGDTINTRQRMQTSPGTRSIIDAKYGKNGEMYYRETIFDQFGRRIGNNDFTDHGTPDVPSHTNPHYHSNSPLDPQAHGRGIPGLHPDTP